MSEVGGGDRSTGPRRNCGVPVCSELPCGPRMVSHHRGVALSLCARLLRLQGPLLPPYPRSGRHTALLGRCAVGVAYLPVAHRCQAVISVHGYVLVSWAAQPLAAKKLVSQDPKGAGWHHWVKGFAASSWRMCTRRTNSDSSRGNCSGQLADSLISELPKPVPHAGSQK